MTTSLRATTFALSLSLLSTPLLGYADELLPPPATVSSAVLYSVDQLTGNLVTIDPNTAAVATVGPTGFTEISGLTYHSPTDRLFGIDGDGENLIAINRYTGAASVVGQLGLPQLYSLTYHEQDDTLYSVDTVGGDLLEIDPETGSAASLGPFAYPHAFALTDDPVTGDLYGSDAGTGRVFTANLDGGITETINDTLPTLNGITFDSSTGRLFAMNTQIGPDRLLRIHSDAGVAIEIGALGTIDGRSLALVPAGVPEPAGAALAIASLLAGYLPRRTYRSPIARYRI